MSDTVTAVRDRSGHARTPICPFDLRVDVVAGMVNLEIADDPHYDGMEIQLLVNTAARYARLQPYQYHGSVYGIIPAKRGYLKPVGAWNTQEIRCIGRRVTVILNGETIVDGDLDEASAGGTLDHKEHPGLARTSGHIVLCGHKSDVKFRRLRVTEVRVE